mmetsp:Transcript_4552/g.14625  ORF Transcript_4552/g.14625 Transcript_4552/m.14625 type:complete len:113 (+) Transcript_4552:412-750(+)
MLVNLVNSIVPAPAGLSRKKGPYPTVIVGIATRANKLVSAITGKNPCPVHVPVIGGLAGATILPVSPLDKVVTTIEAERIPGQGVLSAGTDVVNAMGGDGMPTKGNMTRTEV